MNDRQALELLARDAPIPDAALADRAIAAARASRDRRRAGAVSSLAVLLIIAVPIALFARSGSGPHTPGGGATTEPVAPTQATASSSAPSPARSQISAQADVYVAALSFETLRSPSGRPVASIAVLNHTCRYVATGTGPCDPQPIPAAVQREVLAAAPAQPPVRFVAEKANAGASPVAGRDVIVVTFGPSKISGDTAQLPVETYCGFNCVQGGTLVLTSDHGRWKVTGNTGAVYLS